MDVILLKIIENFITLICFAALSILWIYISSTISFYTNKFIIKKGIRMKIFSYTIMTGILLELILSLISFLVNGIFPQSNNPSHTVILSGFEKGVSIAILLTPLTSMAGAFIGYIIRKPLWKKY